VGTGQVKHGLRVPFGRVITLRLFAAAREAAGTGTESVEGATVGEILQAAERRHGAAFAAVLAGSRVWLNGEPASSGDEVRSGDELAVLPPVSGGSG
jgi:molybdopterin synthase sulfur carrier subunit